MSQSKCLVVFWSDFLGQESQTFMIPLLLYCMMQGRILSKNVMPADLLIPTLFLCFYGPLVEIQNFLFTCVYVLLSVFVQVRLISVPNIRSPEHPTTYVEVNGGSAVGGYGLLCVDDVDIEMGQVLCRCSKPDPKFFRRHFPLNHAYYKGFKLMHRRVVILVNVGQRFRGKFVCKGTELTIDQCRMAVYPVSACSIGDMAIECDTGVYNTVWWVAHMVYFMWCINLYT